MGDERAEKGSLSNSAPIFPGPNKYGSLQLRIKASFRVQMAEDKLNVPLPCDEALNKQIYNRLDESSNYDPSCGNISAQCFIL